MNAIITILILVAFVVLFQSWITEQNNNLDMIYKIDRMRFLLKRMLEENPNTNKELVALVKNELNRND